MRDGSRNLCWILGHDRRDVFRFHVKIIKLYSATSTIALRARRTPLPPLSTPRLVPAYQWVGVSENAGERRKKRVSRVLFSRSLSRHLARPLTELGTGYYSAPDLPFFPSFRSREDWKPVCAGSIHIFSYVCSWVGRLDLNCKNKELSESLEG